MVEVIVDRLQGGLDLLVVRNDALSQLTHTVTPLNSASIASRNSALSFSSAAMRSSGVGSGAGISVANFLNSATSSSLMSR